MNTDVRGFTFFNNYYEIIKNLKEDERSIFCIAILEYVFEGIEPKFDGLLNAIWQTIKVSLDVSKVRSKSGSTVSKKSKIKAKSKQNQNEIKMKSNENQNEIKTKSQPISFSISISNSISKYKNNIKELFIEYLELRKKNKYTITDNVVTRLCKKLDEYSSTDEEKEEILLKAINGAWKDFYPPKEKENKYLSFQEQERIREEEAIRKFLEVENE